MSGSEKAKPVPGRVYGAAVRLYLQGREDACPDLEIVRQWAAQKWSAAGLPKKSKVLVFWVMSQATQDGYEDSR